MYKQNFVNSTSPLMCQSINHSINRASTALYGPRPPLSEVTWSCVLVAVSDQPTGSPLMCKTIKKNITSHTMEDACEVRQPIGTEKVNSGKTRSRRQGPSQFDLVGPILQWKHSCTCHVSRDPHLRLHILASRLYAHFSLHALFSVRRNAMVLTHVVSYGSHSVICCL